MTATTVETFAENVARKMRTGVQLHRVHFHAFERARERRTLTGVVEFFAERSDFVDETSMSRPVRITIGRFELRPGALKRTVCCMILTIMSYRKRLS